MVVPLFPLGIIIHPSYECHLNLFYTNLKRLINRLKNNNFTKLTLLIR